MLQLIPNKGICKTACFPKAIIAIQTFILICGMGYVKAQTSTVSVIIECQAQGADYATLVWGLNNWQIPESLEFDSPTKVKDGALHTPMTPDGDIFLVELILPVNEELNWKILCGKHNSGLEQYFEQKSFLVDSSLTEIILEKPLLLKEKTFQKSSIPPLVIWLLVIITLGLGIILMTSNLIQKLGFSTDKDYSLTIPLKSESINYFLFIVALFSVIMLIGTVIFNQYYRFIGENWAAGNDIKYFLVQFNLANENSVSVWFASMLFFMIGIFGLIIWGAIKSNEDYQSDLFTNLGWIAIAGLFIGFSADELGSIHERLGSLNEANMAGEGGSPWVDLLAIPAAVIGVAALWFFIKSFKEYKDYLVILILGIVILGSVFLQEEFEVRSMEAFEDPDFWVRPLWLLILEEGSELAGSWCFLFAFANLALKISEKGSIDYSPINISVNPRFLIGLMVCLIGLSMIGTSFLSPYLKSDFTEKGTGIIGNWFPAILALLCAFIGWINGKVLGKGNYPDQWLTMCLIGLSAFYGGAFRNGFADLSIGSISSISIIGFSLLISGGIFVFRMLSGLRNTWQKISLFIWLGTLAIALFIPRSQVVYILDISPFLFLLPVLISNHLELSYITDE